MKKLFFSGCLVALVTSLALSQVCFAKQDTLGRITSLSGDVEVKRAKDTEWTEAEFNMSVYFGDHIKTLEDGNITINTPAGQEYVSILRKHPKRPNIIVQLKSSYEVSDIIQTLCEEPLKEEGRAGPRGLNVSYAEVIALLKQMCEKGAVEAEFYAGPMPKISLFIKRK